MRREPTDIDYKKAYEEQLLLTRQLARLMQEKEDQLSEKDILLSQKDTLLSEKENLLTEKETLLQESHARIDSLTQQVKRLAQLMQSGKGERYVSSYSPTAPTLFDLQQIEEPRVAPIPVAAHTKAPRGKRDNHNGRNVLPDSLRREETVLMPEGIDPDFAKKVGEDVTELLAYQPAELYVKRIIRPKYQDLHTGVIHQAKAPERGFARSKVDVSIPSHLLVGKYVDHLPWDRQLKMFSRLGLQTSDSSVQNWIHSAGYFIEPVYEKLKEKVLGSHYLHVDETTIRVLDSDKKGATHQGYYWAYQSHADKLVLFEYQRGRGKEGPREMLQYFKGFLQTDGYQVYEQFGQRDGIVLIHCMAHARRKFHDALGNDKARAEYVLSEIQRLYAIERHIKEHGLLGDAKRAYRQEHAQPILTELGHWMRKAMLEVLPGSAIGKALSYTLPRWERLSLYATTDLLHIDNNPIENSIRPIALGRKNYMFAGNDKAAQRAAMFYSLFATCKNYNIHPYEWLKDVLNRLPTIKINQIEELLPQNWKPQ